MSVAEEIFQERKLAETTVQTNESTGSSAHVSLLLQPCLHGLVHFTIADIAKRDRSFAVQHKNRWSNYLDSSHCRLPVALVPRHVADTCTIGNSVMWNINSMEIQVRSPLV